MSTDQTEESFDSGRARAELNALLGAIVDAVVIIRDDGSIVECNASAERLFGYACGELIGRSVEVLMPEPYRSEHASYVERYRRTGEARIIGIGREALAVKNGGEQFPVLLSVGEAHFDHKRHYVGVLRDLSEQRAAEREQRSLEARLAHVGRFSLMGEMAAGIAHEINQPLSAITNYSQAAKRLLEAESPGNSDLALACNQISEQVQRAGEVIENLRKFIRKQDVSKAAVSVNDVIRDAMSLVEADTNAERITIEVRYAPGLPKVYGNAVQLQQVLLNLTRNAVDAMRDSMRRERRLLIETGGGERVWFSVTDTGPGVSPRLAEGIFHPFVTTKRDGLGVGLAISRTIVQDHGGEIAYTGGLKGGAVFTVTLPALEEDPIE
jgi:two-component system, LuxR family, sensor kinase FixL